MAQTSKTMLSKLSSPLNIIQTDITPLSLRFYQNPDHVRKLRENSDPFTQIDLIIELKSLLRIKPKGRPSSVKNKKRLGVQAGLDKSTCLEPLRFEHEKAQKTHSTRVIGRNSSTESILKEGKAKRMKSHEGKEVLESCVKYNHGKKKQGSG